MHKRMCENCKNTQQSPQLEDMARSKYIQKYRTNLETHAFLQDMLTHYSITLCKNYQDDRCYSFDGDVRKFGNVFGYDYLRYDLDNLLSNITENLLFYGKAYVERVYWYDDQDMLQKVTYRCINCAKIQKRGRKLRYVLKSFDGNTYKGKIALKDIIAFDLKSLGFSKRFFLRKIKKLKKIGLPKAQLIDCKDFSWSVLSAKQDYYLLKLMKDIFWSARKTNNKFVNEPYLIYRKMQYEKLLNSFFNYLITKINGDIQNISQLTGVSGKITFDSITENYDELWEEFNIGKKNCNDIGKVIFKGL